MRIKFSTCVIACAVSCASLVSLVTFATTTLQSSSDTLLRPARISALAQQRLVTTIASAGSQRIVAVGQRGHILLSDDAGKSWAQSASPVSADLTGVQLLDQQHGFAIGHNGVVLATENGGATWKKILDGVSANRLTLEALNTKSTSPDHQFLTAEAQRNLETGPDKPFLDLYFFNQHEGFVVGAYNLIFHTKDGGKSWESWYDRTDNSEKLLNFNAIRAHQGSLFIAGEAGLVLVLDQQKQRFVKRQTPYEGSFFGLLDTGKALIAHGMRGNAVISEDAGQHWMPLQTGLRASITASALGADGSIWLADQSGALSVSRDGGKNFQAVKMAESFPLSAIHFTSGKLILAGARGLRSLPIPKE